MKSDMITRRFKALILCTALVMTLAQCSEEEIVNSELSPSEGDLATEMASATAEVASISVSGVYTEIKGDVPCETCSYFVDASEKIIDGKEMGFEPGTVICLKKSVKYATVDFVNMEGVEQTPIVIGYCGN